MTMLRGLVNYYERLEATGAVPPLHYSREKISFAVVLASDGSVADIQDLRDHSGRKPKPRVVYAPQPVKRTSGIAPNFLWDKTSYTLGVSATSGRVGSEHADFRALHEKLLAGSEDEGLRAVLRFLETWDPSGYESLRYAKEMLDQNVAFRLDGDRGFLHERPAARRIWADYLASTDAETGFCLVTGQEARIARLHPAIKGVPGAQSSGASLVSFNLDAFTSYGKERGANAPVSERAAHAYATALNTLLAREDGVDEKNRPRWRNRVQVGDTTAVFWAEAVGGPEEIERAERSERLLFSTFDSPSDEQEAERIRALLEAVGAGRPVEEVDAGLRSDTRFYVLGLAPNAARLSVRFFLESTFGSLLRAAADHWQDLSIEPHRWTTPPALWRLLRETAPQREAKNVSPALAGELARAVLSGGRYPRTLLSLTLMRIRADREVNALRAAMLKAWLVRNSRLNARHLGFEQEEVPVALDVSEMNPAYRLGRLFATLESIQRTALSPPRPPRAAGNAARDRQGPRDFDRKSGPNATIRDKYFSSASATPARVFPLLLRGAQDHLAKVRNRGQADLATYFDRTIAEIMSGLPADAPFPSTLSLEDQGRFVVGFYHQHATVRSKSAGVPPEISEAAEPTDTESED